MRWRKIVIGAVLAAGVLPLGGMPAASAAGGKPAGSAAPVSVDEETPLYHFEYAYPAIVRTMPALKARLDAERSKARASLKAEALEGQAMAKENSFEFTQFYHSTVWDVVTNLPGWLSLSAMSESFTGGAHPMHWTSGLLWDKAAARERAVTDLFVSQAAFSAAIRKPFCDQLDGQRAERRGGPVDRSSGDMFDECIDPASNTVLLGSTDKAHFTRIGILVDPYAAGPYVEGSYEITLRVTPAVIQAVKPEYRAVFAVPR